MQNSAEIRDILDSTDTNALSTEGQFFLQRLEAFFQGQTVNAPEDFETEMSVDEAISIFPLLQNQIKYYSAMSSADKKIAVGLLLNLLKDYFNFHKTHEIAAEAIAEVREMFPFLPDINISLKIYPYRVLEDDELNLDHASSSGMATPFGQITDINYAMPTDVERLLNGGSVNSSKFAFFGQLVPGLDYVVSMVKFVVAHEYMHCLSRSLIGESGMHVEQGSLLNALEESFSVLGERMYLLNLIAKAQANGDTHTEKILNYLLKARTKDLMRRKNEYFYGYRIIARAIRRSDLIEDIELGDFSKVIEFIRSLDFKAMNSIFVDSVEAEEISKDPLSLLPKK